MLRRIVAVLCALALAFSGAAEAQTYRPGFGLGRPGFQFLSSATGALCANNSLAYYDFVADTGCSAGTNAANSTANLTVSRASIGYDLLATTQFAANVARRTGAGLLVEAAATNYILWSEVNTNAVYVSQGTATATEDAALAPNGTTTADRILYGAAGTYRAQDVTVSGGTANRTFVYSTWIKSNTGSNQTVTLKSTFVGAKDNFSSNLTVTPSWQQFFFSVTNGSGGNGVQGVGIGGTTGVDILAWGQQLATGTSSYIPTTTAAATRAADNITLTLPTGVTKVDLVYSTGTTTVTVSPGTYTLPPNPANSNLLQLKAYAG